MASNTDTPTEIEQDDNQDEDFERCDGCGRRGDWYPLYEGEEFGYRVPEGMKVCNDCLEEHNTHTAADMSDDELIAAIIDDSIGYASPGHAARHVRDFRKGQEAIEADGRRYGCWCERGSSCFDNDLDALIESARKHWLVMSEEKRENLLETVEAWREVEEEQGHGASMGVSMMYPTSGI